MSETWCLVFVWEAAVVNSLAYQLVFSKWTHWPKVELTEMEWRKDCIGCVEGEMGRPQGRGMGCRTLGRGGKWGLNEGQQGPRGQERAGKGSEGGCGSLLGCLLRVSSTHRTDAQWRHRVADSSHKSVGGAAVPGASMQIWWDRPSLTLRLGQVTQSLLTVAGIATREKSRVFQENIQKTWLSGECGKGERPLE